MSVDAQRLMDVMTYFHSVWSAPLKIILALVFLWFTMGPSIFAGVAVLIALIPINTALTAIQKRYQVLAINHSQWVINLNTYVKVLLLTVSTCDQSCITINWIHFAYLLQVQQMAKKDERLKLISEVLNGIKVYRYHNYVKVCLVWRL